MKKKLEIEDLLRHPILRDTTHNLLTGRRRFDEVFENQEYYLRHRKVNRPNLGPWELFLRKNQLAQHNGCGILAQRYSTRGGESGRLFCTKCGHLVGRVARQLLENWEGDTFPIRREGLQAFFLTSKVSKILEADSAPEPHAAPRAPFSGHDPDCGCPDCRYGNSVPENPVREVFEVPAYPLPRPGRALPLPRMEHDPGDSSCPCDACVGVEQSPAYDAPFSTANGRVRALEFAHLRLRVELPRDTFSESDFHHVWTALSSRREDSVQEIQFLTRREADRLGRDPDCIFFLSME